MPQLCGVQVTDLAVKKLRITLSRQDRRTSRPFYTILVLPHARSRFRKLHLSRGFVLTVAGILTLTTLTGLFTPHFLFRLQTQSAAMSQMRHEIERLNAEKESFEEALGEISERLYGFEAQTGRLASALGVEPPDSSRPAAGGPGEHPARPGHGSLLDEELGAIRARSQTLDQSLEELDQAFRGRMRLLASTPSIMPTQGWFSHGFGWRKDPFTGRRVFHRGIDIVNHSGTPIVATADGVVSRATRVSDYGKTIDISHGYGYVTRYAHLSEILVRPGQQVRRGELIGRTGSTGRSTGPHLHYEVFRDGRRLNPWKYLGQKGS
jgi:murein DD-endopeptidase MepM/ murein hydrolase activator NlpD